MAVYRPQTQEEVRPALQALRAGDTCYLPEGYIEIDRIYSFEGVTIIGAGMFKTILSPEAGEMFNGRDGCVFKDFGIISGGICIDIGGNDCVVENISAYRCGKPVKLSGNNHIVRGLYTVKSHHTAIDINGGFIEIDSRKEANGEPKLLRTKRELGLIANLEPEIDNYTAAEIAELRENYERRNMNILIEDCIGIEDGIFYGNYASAWCKVVPQGGGIIFRRNLIIGGLNGIWFDDPAETLSEIYDNVLLDVRDDAIFLEIGTTDQQNFKVYNNYTWGCGTSLFVSGTTGVNSYGNVYGFTQFGKRVNGLSGNRINRGVECFTLPGQPKDKLVATSSAYQAHYIVHENANYVEEDILYSVVNLPFGAQKGVVDTAKSGPTVDTVALDVPREMFPEPPLVDVLAGISAEAYEEAMEALYPSAELSRFMPINTMPAPPSGGSGGGDPDPDPIDPDPVDPVDPDPVDPVDPVDPPASSIEELMAAIAAAVATLEDHEARIKALEGAPDPDPVDPVDPVDPDPVDPVDPVEPVTDEILIFSNDGNKANQDYDNISSTAMAGALLAAAGIKSHFFLNDWINQTYDPTAVNKLRVAGDYVEGLGHHVYDYADNIEATTASLVALLNSGKKVTYLAGGRMLAIREALRATSNIFHLNITLVSHSSVNEGGIWDALKQDYPNVTFVDIKDQNGGFNNTAWNWLDGSSVPAIQNLLDVMRTAEHKVYDPSDAGMVWYYLTGSEDGTPGDVQTYLQANPIQPLA